MNTVSSGMKFCLFETIGLPGLGLSGFTAS